MFKKIFKTKKGIIAFLGSIFLLLGIAVTSIAVIIAPTSSDYFHYEFDGRSFNTKEELDEYIENNIEYTTKETAHDFYLYDQKPYAVDSMYQITKDIEAKNEIKESQSEPN